MNSPGNHTVDIKVDWGRDPQVIAEGSEILDLERINEAGYKVTKITNITLIHFSKSPGCIAYVQDGNIEVYCWPQG